MKKTFARRCALAALSVLLAACTVSMDNPRATPCQYAATCYITPFNH